MQGNQPLVQSYELTIVSPSNLPATPSAPVNVTLGLSVLSKPDGVSDETALGFISLSPAILTFTAPNQLQTTVVTVNVPLGNYSGNYGFKILPSGWPQTLNGITDAGATVNAIATPPEVIDNSPPAITLLSPLPGTVYTYRPATGNPVIVPISFEASVGTNGAPIDSMLAFVDETSVSVTTTGLPSPAATGSATGVLTAPGLHTVSVLATNQNGTSRAGADINVVVEAPPPTITVASPLQNANFTYALGGAGASVPVSVTAGSVYGNISSLTATLDGNPVPLSLSGVNSATTASGSATLIVGAGSHNLTFSAANALGLATPVNVPFTVTGVTPAPTVAFLTPANGTTFNRLSGDPETVVNFTFQGATAYGGITTVNVLLDGTPVPANVVGLGTANVSGSGSVSLSAAGSHILTVTLSNGGASATATTTFNIVQSQPNVCRDLTWLPPVSLNKTVEGGSTVPVKFTLECKGKFVRDTSVLIAIYEVFGNGSGSNPVIFPYGAGSPNPPDYAIDGKQYHLNFTTANGAHVYRIEVYTSAGGSPQLIGTKELNTAGKKPGGGRDNDHDDGSRDDDDRGRR